MFHLVFVTLNIAGFLVVEDCNAFPCHIIQTVLEMLWVIFCPFSTIQIFQNVLISIAYIVSVVIL